MKASREGVRDYPLPKKSNARQNDDIDDVYDDPTKGQAPPFEANKETVSKPPVVKKRRIANKNHSMDAGIDPTGGSIIDVVLKSRKYTRISN